MRKKLTELFRQFEQACLNMDATLPCKTAQSGTNISEISSRRFKTTRTIMLLTVVLTLINGMIQSAYMYFTFALMFGHVKVRLIHSKVKP
jgi:hypothetical protein